MESKQRRFIGYTAVLSVVGVGLMVAGFATDRWVTAKPHQHNDTNPNVVLAYNGTSWFGLFNGEQTLNYGGSPRGPFSLPVTCDPGESVCAYVFMRPETIASKKLSELIARYKIQTASSANSTNGTTSTSLDQIYYGLFSFPLWLSTVVFLALSVLMGLVTTGFTVFNVFGRPIEMITGPLGLYLWNVLTELCVVVTMALFGTLYSKQLSENFMMFDDYHIGWRSSGYTNLDYSFAFIGGAGGAFLINLILLCLSGQSLNCCTGSSEIKMVNSDMILY